MLGKGEGGFVGGENIWPSRSSAGTGSVGAGSLELVALKDGRDSDEGFTRDTYGLFDPQKVRVLVDTRDPYGLFDPQKA